MPKTGIEMNPIGFTKWISSLREKNIFTASGLRKKILLNGDSIEPKTARSAYDKGKVLQETWEYIFESLELPPDAWREYFSETEWDDYRDKAVWGMLLDLAVDATDRFGIVYPPNIPKMGMGGDYSRHQQKRIQTKIPKEKHVLLEIPEGLKGYLIVLEDHASSDDIYLLAPSHWLENSEIDSKPIQLPKPATSDYRGIQLETLGQHHLWAGVFGTLPDWEWLQPQQEDFRRLDTSHLRQLLEYAESQPRKTTTLLRSSYTVVAN